MTKGIARFIYFGGKVASMPERQVDDLRLLMASPIELEITEENLLPGEKIIAHHNTTLNDSFARLKRADEIVF